MRLVFARHGETEWNLQKKFYGLSDVSLDDKGLLQAQHLANTLRKNNWQFDVGYCSGLIRTYQTLKPCLNPATPIVKLPGLNEKGFGKWEGLDADEIEASYPKEWQLWLNQPFDYVPPEAEDFYQFSDHVKRAIDQIISVGQKNNYQNILVVAHLGALRIIDQYLLNDTHEFWDIHFDAGCYTEFSGDSKQNFKLVKRNVG
ncbi:histidine phosphatase family protein [Companilactobacillus sp.]|uniref:histidine phosphatase family protein n=1 Tax=Companilactobacillus sp. TaxID=2767905 RepID=UPI00260294C3|nr:histidine phosphatase family protein [Companilactobacillus sp.]